MEFDTKDCMKKMLQNLRMVVVLVSVWSNVNAMTEVEPLSQDEFAKVISDAEAAILLSGDLVSENANFYAELMGVPIDDTAEGDTVELTDDMESLTVADSSSIDHKDAKKAHSKAEGMLKNLTYEHTRGCYNGYTPADKRAIYYTGGTCVVYPLIKILEQLQKALREENISCKDLATIFCAWLAQNKVNKVDDICDQEGRTLFDVADLCGYKDVYKVLEAARSA